jgi:UDP-glucose 4-epimerase
MRRLLGSPSTSARGEAVRVLITGGAGFIGSNVADALIARGDDVVIYDNFATGQRAFIASAVSTSNASVIEGDILDEHALVNALEGCDAVIHLAANADVRHGLKRPQVDLEQNIIGTFTVLNTMRQAGIQRILFSSTGSVYGEPEIFPTPETCPFPRQTSLYGASKVAGEGLIQAFCEGYGFAGVICRFVSILGERYTHGHLFDFYRSLMVDPSRLHVLGNGRQTKSYLYVGDCVRAMLLLLDGAEPGICRAFNLGTDETIDVDESVRRISAHLGIEPKISYAGDERGWVGDSPLIHLDCTKLRALGWTPNLTISEGIDCTLAWFDSNHWVFSEEGVTA